MDDNRSMNCDRIVLLKRNPHIQIHSSVFLFPLRQLTHYLTNQNPFAVEEGCEEDQQQEGVVRQAEPEVVDVDKGAGGVQREGEGEPAENGRDGIGHAVVALAYEVAEEDAGAVAGEAAPGAGHVADARDEEDVDEDKHGAADGAHDGAPVGFGGELVPEGEVEVDAHENFRHHDDGHSAEAVPVVALDDVAEEVHVADDDHERQEGEHDEVFHDKCLAFFALLALPSGKHKGLISVAEGLGDHCHNHGDFDAGAVDAELFVHVGAGIEEGEEDFVEHLVEDAHDTEDEQGPGVLKHALQQLEIENRESEIFEFAPEAEGHQGGAEEVDIEDVADVVLLVVPLHEGEVLALGGHEEDEEVEPDVEDDKGEFECGEFPGFVFETQACEEDGLEGVERHDDGHDGDVLGVGLIAHGGGNGAEEEEDGEDEEEADGAYRGEGCGEDLPAVGALLVGEVEEGGLHAEGEDDQEEGRVGVDVGHHAIAAGGGGDVVGVEGHEKVVQETPHDAAKAVDDRVGKEFFQ